MGWGDPFLSSKTVGIAPKHASRIPPLKQGRVGKAATIYFHSGRIVDKFVFSAAQARPVNIQTVF